MLGFANIVKTATLHMKVEVLVFLDTDPRDVIYLLKQGDCEGSRSAQM
jgi:hypothetical protein